MTEEVYKNWVKRSSRNEKNFIGLKQKDFIDEINNFFMNSYWSKTGIHVKLMRKVSKKWKNWRSFRVLPSILLRGENWSKIRILFWNLLGRYSTCKMKWIVWVIQEIFKMLNQYAVDIPTLPVNQCLSHLIHFLVECWAVLYECRAGEKGPPSIWDTHGISGNVFADPVASSTAPYPQELNPWSSGISEPIHSSTAEKKENRTPVQDQRCQSGPSAKSSVIPSEGDPLKNYGADQQRLQISFRFSFRQIPYTSNVCLLEDKVQDRGMYLFTISYGNYAVDQRSGVGWFSGRFEIFVIYSWYFNAEFWSTWCEDCFGAEQNHP